MMSDSGKATSGNKTSQWDRAGGMEAWGGGVADSLLYLLADEFNDNALLDVHDQNGTLGFYCRLVIWMSIL